MVDTNIKDKKLKTKKKQMGDGIGHKDGLRAQAAGAGREAVRDVRRVEDAVPREFRRKDIPHNCETDEHDAERRALRADSQQRHTQASGRRLHTAAACAYCATLIISSGSMLATALAAGSPAGMTALLAATHLTTWLLAALELKERRKA